MAAFLSVEPVRGYEVEDFIESFADLASKGRRIRDDGMGHPHGWGMAAFLKGELLLYVRETFPAWRRAHYARFNSDGLLAHARAASIGEISLVNTHPFLLVINSSPWAFAHNGTVKGIRVETSLGNTDSEALFRSISDLLADPDPEALAHRYGEIERMSEEGTTSLTSIILSPSKLIAVKWAIKRGDYFNIFVREEDGRVALASEPLDRSRGWKEMENREVILWERKEEGIVKRRSKG